MSRTTVQLAPAFRIFSNTQVAPLGGTEAYYGDVHYATREAAEAALAEKVAADQAALLADGYTLDTAGGYSEEDGFLAYSYGTGTHPLHLFRAYEVVPAYAGPLYGADEHCEHLVEHLLSGFVCVRCHGTARPPQT